MNKPFIDLNLPSVPHVAFKILNILDDPYVNLKKLEEIILADQSLAAKILKIANSAYYGMRNKVNLVSEALNIMGFRVLRDVVIVASLKEVYKVFGLIEKKLWEHGVGVSVAASIATEYVPIVKREEASLAGLIHDIGKIILNKNFPSKYADCINFVHTNQEAFEIVERRIFNITHLETGKLLADKWGFSEVLKTVIYNHSNMEYMESCQDIYEKTIILVINLADSICTRLGVGYKEPMPQLVKNEEKVLNLLRLNTNDYSEIVNKFIDQYPFYIDNLME